MTKNRDIILARLRKARGQYLTSSILSSELGISRAAVWKQVCALRQAGYQISAQPNRGYRLEEEPDLLDEGQLANRGIIYYQAVDSTNLTARHHAESGAPHNSIITAEEQLQGRGRLGRSWYSPKRGGLWFSMILRPRMLTPQQVAPVTLVTAAVLADYFNKHHHLPLKVKWPNDLLIRNKKTGGILTELKGELERIDYLIIGIGLNISQQSGSFPQELDTTATSIFIESGRRLDRTALLLALRDKLAKAYEVFFSEGFDPFLSLWKKYNTTLGNLVTVSWQGGKQKGKAIDITKKGALILQNDKGENETINYGELI